MGGCLVSQGSPLSAVHSELENAEWKQGELLHSPVGDIHRETECVPTPAAKEEPRETVPPRTRHDALLGQPQKLPLANRCNRSR